MSGEYRKCKARDPRPAGAGTKKEDQPVKPSDIRVGTTYRNRGKGRTTRTVIAIGIEHRPAVWYGNGLAPDEPGVKFTQPGMSVTFPLYLSSFARWAGSEVKEGGES